MDNAVPDGGRAVHLKFRWAPAAGTDDGPASDVCASDSVRDTGLATVIQEDPCRTRCSTSARCSPLPATWAPPEPSHDGAAHHRRPGQHVAAEGDDGQRHHHRDRDAVRAAARRRHRTAGSTSDPVVVRTPTAQLQYGLPMLAWVGVIVGFGLTHPADVQAAPRQDRRPDLRDRRGLRSSAPSRRCTRRSRTASSCRPPARRSPCSS